MSPASPGGSILTDTVKAEEWTWETLRAAMSAIMSDPTLRLRVLIGSLTMSLTPTTPERVAAWLFAASRHAKEGMEPVRVQFFPDGTAAIGVQGAGDRWVYLQGMPLYINRMEDVGPLALLLPTVNGVATYYTVPIRTIKL